MSDSGVAESIRQVIDGRSWDEGVELESNPSCFGSLCRDFWGEIIRLATLLVEARCKLAEETDRFHKSIEGAREENEKLTAVNLDLGGRLGSSNCQLADRRRACSKLEEDNAQLRQKIAELEAGILDSSGEPDNDCDATITLLQNEIAARGMDTEYQRGRADALAEVLKGRSNAG